MGQLKKSRISLGSWHKKYGNILLSLVSAGIDGQLIEPPLNIELPLDIFIA